MAHDRRAPGGKAAGGGSDVADAAERKRKEKMKRKKKAQQAKKKAGAAGGGAAENGASAAGQVEEAHAAGGKPEENALDDKAWLEAAKSGDLTRMALALRHDESLLNERGGGIGHSALHWAAARGHVRVLDWLLGKGADIALLNHSGSTALHAAAANGQLTCAARLVKRGGAALVAMRDADDQDAEAIARQRGYADVAELLRVSATATSSPAPKAAAPAAAEEKSKGSTRAAAMLVAPSHLADLEVNEIDCLLNLLGSLREGTMVEVAAPLSLRETSSVARLSDVLTAELRRREMD
mmetsp:Transcript_39003/g.94744  ORF Transcript_39003/g.94744 Transcript_39003/m.94744 type:complete len:296 (+) Transcript_39003:3-890(+)